MRDTAYVNALAVSAQKSLLPKSKFLTMAEASSPEDALSVLKRYSNLQLNNFSSVTISGLVNFPFLFLLFQDVLG